MGILFGLHILRSGRRGFTPKLTDAEVLTMEICEECFQPQTDKAIFRYFRSHYPPFFPIDRPNVVCQAGRQFVADNFIRLSSTVHILSSTYGWFIWSNHKVMEYVPHYSFPPTCNSPRFSRSHAPAWECRADAPASRLEVITCLLHSPTQLWPPPRWRVGTRKEAILQGGREHLAEVIATIHSTQALTYAKGVAQQEIDLAVAALAKLPESPYKEALYALAHFSMHRNY